MGSNTLALVRLIAICTASFLISGCSGIQQSVESDKTEDQSASVEPPVEVEPPIAAGDACKQLGLTIQVDGETFECRFQKEMARAFVRVENSMDVPSLAMSDEPLDICRIQDSRPEAQGGATGFPARGERMRVDGQLDLAIVPIDFPDEPARMSVQDFVMPQVEKFLATFDIWAGDNEEVKWHIPDEWLRMPKDAKYYQWDHPTVQGDGSLRLDSSNQLITVEEQQYDIFSEAELVMDLDEVDFAFVIANPEAYEVLFAPYSHDRIVKTATATYDFPHYGFGRTITANWQTRGWTYLWHEMLHFRGIAGHAPGNEFPYNLMAAGETLNVWDAFLLGWQEEEQLLCFDAQNLGSETFLIGAMERPVSGPRGAVLRVDDNTALVIESRRKGAFNALIPQGFAGVQAYVVDTSRVAQRFDGNIARELDYFAYHLRIDSMDHEPSYLIPQMWVSGYPDLNETAFPGDSFTFRGVKVEYLEGGDFDLIRVSADGGVLPASHDETLELNQALYLARKAESQGFCGCCGCFPGAQLH